MDIKNKNFWLMQGDCLERMKEIKDNSVDLILCDLPYGTTSCKWDSVIPFKELWEQYNRVSKPNTAVVLTASQPFSSALGFSNLANLKYSWYWQKTRATGHLNAKKQPMKDIEDILVFYKNPPVYNPQGLIYKPTKVMNSKSHSLRNKDNITSTVSGGIKHKEYLQEYTNYPRQVLQFQSEGATVHPTQKPLGLMEYLILTYTNNEGIVLDNCMGSGTTGVACVNQNRKFIGIEMDEGYFKIAKDRIEGSVKNE